MVLMSMLLILPLLSCAQSAVDPRDQRTGLVVTNDTTSFCPNPDTWSSRYRNWGCPYYNCQDLTKTLNDTVWLATFSHAISEGGAGERAYTSRSTDEGQSWSFMAPLESSMALASHGSGFIKGSTAVPLTRNANRVWVVYQYNSENTTATPDGKPLHGRSDMLGKGFFFRWTDDGGVSWSDHMFREFRSTNIDLRNPWGGVDVKLMHIDAEPEVIGQRVYIPFTKCQVPTGETSPAEPWIFSSPDLLQLEDPTQATWELLPRGDVGVMPPDNTTRLLEENHLVMVGDNPDRLLMLGRGETGKIWATYSSDGGNHFDSPAQWLTYTPGGNDYIKNPRGSAAPFRVPSTGQYILLYYNNPADQSGSGRYTMWISGGTVVPSSIDGVDSSVIAWSQPEILLFDPTWIPLTPTSSRDPMVAWPAGSQASGYVGFYEDSSGIAYIGSQKSGYELMHRIPQSLLDALWTQHSVKSVPAGATLDVTVNSTVATYRLASMSPSLDQNGGLSISAWLRPMTATHVHRSPTTTTTVYTPPPAAGGSLTASCDAGGFSLIVHESLVEFSFTIAGKQTTIVPTGMCVDELLSTTRDTVVTGSSTSREATHVGVIVDGGAHLVSLVVNGVLCDGNKDGKVRDQGPRGWLYLPSKLHSLGGCQLDISSSVDGIGHIRVYPRALLTTEMIGSWRFGAPLG